MTFRVVRTNQYNQYLGLIHSTNGNHLESPNEGSSIDHQVTILLHAQNITMFPTNETWAAVTADSMDFRKEFRALNAKVTSLDEQVAATRNDLLEFRAQAQETLNHIADQLSELIAFINRGGNNKKGEVRSSHPKPPPDDQNRGSVNTAGGSGVRTTDIVDRFSGSRDGQKEVEVVEGTVLVTEVDLTVGDNGGSGSRSWLQPDSQGILALELLAAVDRIIRSTTGNAIPPSIYTRRSDGFWHDRILLVTLIETSSITITGGGRRCGAAAAALGGGRRRREVCGEEGAACSRDTASRGPTTIVTPKSQFRTCPSDHGKAPRNIAP
ncbi:hypothetical protein F511_09150 [Dorcoceras hygrometricum]|uniref:Uncharacterized protein n=1 Tax=Dorcoceras hygrometricum TaxID=472368 RepID=A0A2Z7AV69_9LAMI|nr:hypothetical protein F511_09150 [Dorcoceras hygrometricum]